MTFTSLAYFFFLPAVYLVFYFSPDRWRRLVLLLASYGFYASFKAPYLLAVLLGVTAVSYFCGLKIAASQEETYRKRWLWWGVGACVATLAVLKYLPFLETRTNSILGLNSGLSQALVTIGVSYFTFQAIAYLFDIYLEIEEEPERHFGRFALYMAFFPKLLQGPIERAGALLPQLRESYRFDYDAMRSGMLLFAWGLFKKVVLADRLALYADQVYNNVHNYTGLALLIGTYAFALQLYFDFSGYTDMARGTARLFGINLTENFNRPYLATSIAEFWRRWHISFSRWILDYIFKPLQMGWRDWGQAGTALALVITFLVSGIWHGATWGFVIWGLLHGSYLAVSTYYRPYQRKLHHRLGIEKSRWLRWWQVLVTFNLVSFAWIFFRANSLTDALYIISKVLQGTYNIQEYIRSCGKLNLIIIILLLIIMTLASIYSIKAIRLLKDLKLVRWVAYYVLIFSILLLGNFGESKFLYFKF